LQLYKILPVNQFFNPVLVLAFLAMRQVLDDPLALE
jgi:hypothetical protein